MLSSKEEIFLLWHFTKGKLAQTHRTVVEHMDIENGYQKLWAFAGHLVSLGFTGTATSLKVLRHPGRPKVDSEQGLVWGSLEMQL